MHMHIHLHMHLLCHALCSYMGFKNVKLESMAPTPTTGTCEFDFVSYRRPNMKKKDGSPTRDKPGALPSHFVATDGEVEVLIDGLYLYTDKHVSAFDEHPDVKYRRKEREQFTLLARIGHVFKAQLARMRFKRETEGGNEEGIKEAIVWYAQCMFRARQQNREKERIKAEREMHDKQKVGGKTKSARSLTAKKAERLAKAAEKKAAAEAAEAARKEARRLKSIAEEDESGSGGRSGRSQPNSPKSPKSPLSPFAAKDEAKDEGGAPALTAGEKAELKANFDAIDTDQGGTLDRSEFKAAMELAFSKHPDKPTMPSDDVLQDEFDRCDADKNGTIDLDEFLEVFAKIKRGEGGGGLLGVKAFTIDPALTDPAALAAGAPRRGSLLHVLKGSTERRMSVLAALQRRGRKLAFDRVFTNGLFPLRVSLWRRRGERGERGGEERGEERRREEKRREEKRKEKRRGNRSAEKTVNRM